MISELRSPDLIDRITVLKIGRLSCVRSSNHSSMFESLLGFFRDFAAPPGISCRSVAEMFPLPPPSFTGQPKSEGSPEEALETIESMHCSVIPSDPAKGETDSQALRALMDSRKLL
uniref:Uncharacterized protein n=1 Tax=Arabidopsis thaliana TaxID=3702 RepID=Q0WQW3_ARATH|nr:hypothetical protein [Arabidopsis thaliana]